MIIKIFDKKVMVKAISLLVIFNFAVFLALEIVSGDTVNEASGILKFISIILCFSIVLLIGKDGYDRRDTFLLQAAKFCTVIADFFLVIAGNYKLGVGFFCIVQFIYILRHSRNLKLEDHTLYKILVIYLILFFIIINNIDTIDIEQPLLVLVVTYGFLLITSVYMAFKSIKLKFYTKKGALMICSGMILFFLCDINVAMFNSIGSNLSHGNELMSFQFLTGFLIWIFYLPSQLLLSLSGFKTEKF